MLLSSSPSTPATGRRARRADRGAPFRAVKPPTCLGSHGHHKRHSTPWSVAAGHGDMHLAGHVLAHGWSPWQALGGGDSALLTSPAPYLTGKSQGPRLRQTRGLGLQRRVCRAPSPCFCLGWCSGPSGRPAPGVPHSRASGAKQGSPRWL